jgi:hypothetical protein
MGAQGSAVGACAGDPSIQRVARHPSRGRPGTSPAVGIGFERLLFAFRDDLGNKRGDLQEGDLLRVFVQDIDEYLLAYRLLQAQQPLPEPDEHDGG